MKNNGACDLVSVNPARLAGFLLELAAGMLENPIAQVFLAGLALAAERIVPYRKLEAYFSRLPV